MSTTAKKVNPFASAAKKETAKKDDKQVIVIPGLAADLNDFSQAKAAMNAAEAKKKLAEGIIKEKGREKFLELLRTTNRNPGSFKITDEGAAPVLFGVQDRYTTGITEEDAEKIEGQFPGVVVSAKTYEFNAEILERHFDVIAEALGGIDIPEEDLAGLLIVKEKYTAKKGTIDTLATFGDRAPELFEIIQPVCFLK